LTDAAVEQSIQGAVNWLKGQRSAAGHWESGDNPGSRYWGGDTALVVLALLYAGEDPRSEFMSSALKWLARGQVRAGSPPLSACPVGRRYVVLCSPLDITVGLVGARAYGCVGYGGDSALRVMRNLLLYADLSTPEKARLMREAESQPGR